MLSLIYPLALLTVGVGIPPIIPVARTPAQAVSLAATDTYYLADKDKRFYRYLWIPEPAELPVSPIKPGGVGTAASVFLPGAKADIRKREEQVRQHYEDWWLLTKIQCNLLSDQGAYGNPVVVAPGLLRIDVREYGWDKRLEVWEKLAKIDYVFHSKAKLLVDVTRAIAWVGGVDEKGVEWKPGLYPTQFKADDVLDIPAAWVLSEALRNRNGDVLVDSSNDPWSAIDYLRNELITEVPVVMASWWFVQTARQTDLRNNDEPGVGYYDWLGLKDRDAFFEICGVDEKKAIKLFSELREVVTKSGISQQNRQIVRLGSSGGQGSGVWGTLDTFNQSGRGIAQENLRRGEFQHNAEEWYGTLPNGLFVTFLGDQNGKRAATAPDKIGPDSSTLCIGNDKRVHINLSCIRCHGVDKDFLKPINGWARKTFRIGGNLRLQDPDDKVYKELKSNYLRELDQYLADDRIRYLRSVANLTVIYKVSDVGQLVLDGMGKPLPARVGQAAPAFTKLYGGAWNQYVEEDLGIEEAARELGVPAGIFQKNLEMRKGYIREGNVYVDGRKNLTLAAFLDSPPQKITRLSWEAIYPVAMMIALGLDPPEVPTKVKVLPEKK